MRICQLLRSRVLLLVLLGSTILSAVLLLRSMANHDTSQTILWSVLLLFGCIAVVLQVYERVSRQQTNQVGRTGTREFLHPWAMTTILVKLDNKHTSTIDAWKSLLGTLQESLPDMELDSDHSDTVTVMMPASDKSCGEVTTVYVVSRSVNVDHAKRPAEVLEWDDSMIIEIMSRSVRLALVDWGANSDNVTRIASQIIQWASTYGASTNYPEEITPGYSYNHLWI